MKNLKNISIAVSVLLLGVFLFVFNENNFDFEMNSDKSHIDKSNKSEELKNEIKENKSEVEIFAMGDMIFHQRILPLPILKVL